MPTVEMYSAAELVRRMRETREGLVGSLGSLGSGTNLSEARWMVRPKERTVRVAPLEGGWVSWWMREEGRGGEGYAMAKMKTARSQARPLRAGSE